MNDIQHKVTTNKPTAVQEEKPTTSYLGSLFKPPTDPDDAEAELDVLFGRKSTVTTPNGSFTI